MASPLIEQIYDSILKLIAGGEIAPGGRLPSENEMSERFGVSRNTVRAALNKLSVLGFTETKHGGGTYVRKVGSEVYMNFFIPAFLLEEHDQLDVLEFRKGIEMQAVRLAAERANDEDIARLRALIDESKANDYSGVERADHNTSFHAAVAQASHNSMFTKTMEIISSIFSTKMQDFQTDQGKDIDSNFYHSMVLECIINRKPDEAAYFMEQHLTKVIDRYRDFNERHREDGALNQPPQEPDGSGQTA